MQCRSLDTFIPVQGDRLMLEGYTDKSLLQFHMRFWSSLSWPCLLRMPDREIWLTAVFSRWSVQLQHHGINCIRRYWAPFKIVRCWWTVPILGLRRFKARYGKLAWGLDHVGWINKYHDVARCETPAYMGARAAERLKLCRLNSLSMEQLHPDGWVKHLS